jgi:hypothetical protein
MRPCDGRPVTACRHLGWLVGTSRKRACRGARRSIDDPVMGAHHERAALGLRIALQSHGPIDVHDAHAGHQRREGPLCQHSPEPRSPAGVAGLLDVAQDRQRMQASARRVCKMLLICPPPVLETRPHRHGSSTAVRARSLALPAAVSRAGARAGLRLSGRGQGDCRQSGTDGVHFDDPPPMPCLDRLLQMLSVACRDSGLYHFEKL